jgi:hypothetical protein
MWSDTDIPKGYVLCDGSNDTPDLRGRFILGAYKEVDKEKDKDIPIKEAINKAGVGKAFINNKKTLSGSGLDMGKEEYIYDIDRVCPPYYALYYIMKVADVK